MAAVSTPSWLAPAPPGVAIEIAARHVTVAQMAGPRGALASHATEALPEGAVLPSLQAVNIPDPMLVTGAIARAMERAGVRAGSRAALVIPDAAARVSLLPLDQLPARAADLDQLVRWQLRKATPFPIDDAQVSHVVASRTAPGVLVAATVARRAVITEYEGAAEGAGVKTGLVDLASVSVMNAIMAAGLAPSADWLLVHLATDATTLAILRGSELLFYRHRSGTDGEPLGVLVHQTAMYHEDRLGGGAFAQVWIAGADTTDSAVQAVADRLGTLVRTVDLTSTLNPSAALTHADQHALAAPAGILLREREVA